MWNKNFYYRISKYNPIFRVKELYEKPEWTSIYDVGKLYDGTEFTMNDYIDMEEKYLCAIEKLLDATQTKSLRIIKLEDHQGQCCYRQWQRLHNKNDIIFVAQNCLREKYWCELYSRALTIHFGYEFYIYVRCALSYQQIVSEISSLGLFVENNKKP